MERTQLVNPNTGGLKRTRSDGDVHIDKKQKQSKPNLVTMPPHTLLHIASFLTTEEYLNLKKVPNSVFKTGLDIIDIDNTIVPKTDIYKTEQIEKVKQMHDDALDNLFRMHTTEDISNTILRLCTNPLLPEHAPTYMAQAFAYLIKAPLGRSLFLDHDNREGFRKAFLDLANQTNHNSHGREFLAEVFKHLFTEFIKYDIEMDIDIDEETERLEMEVTTVFFNNNLFQNTFINLVNHPDHNLEGRNHLAEEFDRIVYSKLFNYNSLRNAFMNLAKHLVHDSKGRNHLTRVFLAFIENFPNEFIFNNDLFQNTFINLVNHPDHNSWGHVV